MTCRNERVRIQKRRTRKSDRLGTMDFRGELYFAELARRPISRGAFLLMQDIELPVAPYREDDPYWAGMYHRISTKADATAQMQAHYDGVEAEWEARYAEHVQDFGDQLVTADRGLVTFDMSPIRITNAII